MFVKDDCFSFSFHNIDGTSIDKNQSNMIYDFSLASTNIILNPSIGFIPQTTMVLFSLSKNKSIVNGSQFLQIKFLRLSVKHSFYKGTIIYFFFFNTHVVLFILVSIAFQVYYFFFYLQ